jgi:hypothetical protein
MIQAHQPGSQPLDIPEAIPNPAVPRTVPNPSPRPSDPVKVPVPQRAARATRVLYVGHRIRHANGIRAQERARGSVMCCEVWLASGLPIIFS